MENNNNFTNNSQKDEYLKIIARLENYEKLKQCEIDFMADNYAKHTFLEKNYDLLYYFFVCVDWKWAYHCEQTAQSITIYNIVYNGVRNKEEFTEAIAALKALFLGIMEFQRITENGKIIYTFDIYPEKKDIKNRIEHYDINDIYRILISKTNSVLKKGVSEIINPKYVSIEKKNIHEFFKAVFAVFGIDNYANTDEEVKLLFGDKISDYHFRGGKFRQFVESTIDALEYIKNFKKLLKQRNKNSLAIYHYEIGQYFISHVLFRHVQFFKIEHQYKDSDLQEIKQIIGGKIRKKVSITYEFLPSENNIAIEDSILFLDEVRSLIGKDGIFADNFTNICSDFYDLLCGVLSKNPSKDKDIVYYEKKFCKVDESGENVVYYERELYRLVFDQDSTNQINTFYPLNNQKQQPKYYYDSNGNLKYDDRIYLEQSEYDFIINPNEMPDEFRKRLYNKGTLKPYFS